MRHDARSTLDTLAELWERERLTARARAAQERRDRSLAERVARGLVLTRLVVDEVEPVPGRRSRLWLARKDGAPLAPEDARLSSGDPAIAYRSDPAETGAARVVVSRYRGGRLAVVLDGDPPDHLDGATLRLERDAPEVTFDRGAEALSRWRGRDRGPLSRLREVLYGGGGVEVGGGRVEAWFDGGLEQAQREAVRHALTCDPVALIHGPPGTGKTRTLVEVIRQAVGRGGGKVLATAASNTAVDNLAERLIAAGVEVVRLGHPARVLPGVEDHTLDAVVDRSEGARLAARWVSEALALKRRVLNRFDRGRVGWRERRDQLAEVGRLFKDAREALRGAQDVAIARAQVICATASGAGARELRGVELDLVVFDEATQAPDPLALVALERAPRVVMAGDPMQLPPTVLDRAAEREGLGKTAFERVYERLGGQASRMLVVQHRMHEALMSFPSERLYGGRLVAAPQVAGHRLEDLEGVRADPLRPGPLVLVGVAAEVARLLGRGVAPADCAVITPYDAQVRLLRARLDVAIAQGLEVDSIDGFQGREKEAVVVDLVRCNEGGDVGFLADVRRMNVALTRARRFLLVVGDSATLGGHDFYAGLFDAVERAGGWVSAWSDAAPPFDG